MQGLSFLTIVYFVLLTCSIALLCLYNKILKDNVDKNGTMAFVSIIVIDLGYFLLSISKTVKFAIFSNRLSYCGSVMLLVEMFLLVNKFCNNNIKNIVKYLVQAVSVIVLLIALTGGSSIKIFYKSVDINIVNNVTHLVKEYGSLHRLYGFYVLGIVLYMLTITIKAILNKKVISSVSPAILILLISENLIVWFIEKIAVVEVELLAASYVTTAAILLMLFKNNDEYQKINVKNNQKIKTVNEVIHNWKEQYKLTDRELQIVNCLIENTPRTKIAEQLFISEHTVKKHTTHIYEKLHVMSRNDLLYKLNEELTH